MWKFLALILALSGCNASHNLQCQVVPDAKTLTPQEQTALSATMERTIALCQHPGFGGCEFDVTSGKQTIAVNATPIRVEPSGACTKSLSRGPTYLHDRSGRFIRELPGM